MRYIVLCLSIYTHTHVKIELNALIEENQRKLEKRERMMVSQLVIRMYFSPAWLLLA